ncbi:NADH-quinone oxidoreductase subunit J [Micromonospora sp. M12]
MTGADVLLLALGAVAVGAGVLVVTTKHLVRAGLYLVVCLGALAGDFLVLSAELVAWVQVLIYVGAVVVLLLFAVMLTRAPIGASDDLDRPGWPAALIGGGAGLGLTVLLVDAYRWSAVALPSAGTAERLGEQIFQSWVLPFEVLSVLLLSALVGAIVLSRPDIGRPARDARARQRRPTWSTSNPRGAGEAGHPVRHRRAAVRPRRLRRTASTQRGAGADVG